MSKPRVLIADDHRIFAEGLRGLLETKFEVVGVVSDGQELVATALKLLPDVVVTDVTMPLLNGIDAAAELLDLGVTARVVFLTMHREIGYIRRAMATGAAGYVLKHSASEELVTAIREAVSGGTYVSPLIAGELLQSYRNAAAPDDPIQQLTGRQREVLKLIAEGSSAKQISAALKISVRTAETHRANIMEALEIHSIAELTQYAIRHGIISVE